MTLPSKSDVDTYLKRLWPILRSITGAGQRETHDILSEIAPFRHIDFPTGARVLDWDVPKEWVFREAYIQDSKGNRIVDARDNNLHIVNYARPYRGRLSLSELRPHLHTLPERPHAIPYVTSYYADNWGFCLSENTLAAMQDDLYDVVVDTDLVDGVMRVSENVLPGAEPGEVLFSSYTCHPSMANNELSGPLVLAFLCRAVAAMPNRRLTYRFVLGPENIGSIAYLSTYGEHFRKHLTAGYVLSCIGDERPMSIKKSQRGDTVSDLAAHYAFKESGRDFRIFDFDPRGADERNYCSPGYDFPVCALFRSFYNEFDAYHTSDDNLDLIDAGNLIAAVESCLKIVDVLEANRIWKSTAPFGEPFFTRHNLAPVVSKPDSTADDRLLARRWIMNQANGTRDLLAIAERSGLALPVLAEEALSLEQAGLLVPVDERSPA